MHSSSSLLSYLGLIRRRLTCWPPWAASRLSGRRRPLRSSGAPHSPPRSWTSTWSRSARTSFILHSSQLYTGGYYWALLSYCTLPNYTQVDIIEHLFYTALFPTIHRWILLSTCFILHSSQLYTGRYYWALYISLLNKDDHCSLEGRATETRTNNYHRYI